MNEKLFSILILLMFGCLVTGCNKSKVEEKEESSNKVEDKVTDGSQNNNVNSDPNVLVCHYESNSWVYEGNNTSTVYRTYTWKDGLLVHGELSFVLNFDDKKVDKEYVNTIYESLERVDGDKYNLTRVSDFVIKAVNKENTSGFREETTKEQVRSVLTGDSYNAICD